MDKEFLEYKRTYSGELQIFKCTLAKRTDDELVLIYRISKLMRFAGVDFPPDSRSFGFYWKDRNYNVYHWKDPQGNTLLSYFNISKDTKINHNKVEWLDLIVDIAVHPDGRIEILDEDEIPENMNSHDLLIIQRTRGEILGNLEVLVRELDERIRLIIQHKARRK